MNNNKMRTNTLPSPPPQAPQRPPFSLGTSSLILLAVAWILPGLFGHQPWKPDEAYTFGLVYHIVKTGDWIVPALAGEPFMEKPPAFFIVAAIFARSFSAWLPLHDAARLATAFFMALTCAFTAMAGRALHGESHGRLAVVILLGCLGLIVRAHELITDTALLAGFALSFYGLAVARAKPLCGGLALGTGVGLGFMSKGLLAPGIIGILAVLLPVAGKDFRSRRYVLALCVSLLAMLPWLALWPWLLYERSPPLFDEWFFTQNWGRFLGTVHLSYPNEPAFYFRILPWYGWPAWPLALWALWRGGRAAASTPQIQLPLLGFIVIISVLSAAGDAREVYALPLLVPLSLLAAARLDGLSHRTVHALDQFGVGVLTLAVTGLWLGWLCAVTNWPAEIAARIRDTLHAAALNPVQPLPLLAALAVSMLSLAAIFYTRRLPDRAIVNWTVGVTLIWTLAMTLWLPFIDHQKAYRQTLSAMRQAMPSTYKCVASRRLGEPQRALLDYYLGLRTERLKQDTRTECDLLLFQTKTHDEPSLDPAWKKIWEGSRPGDDAERLWLYRKPATPESMSRVSGVEMAEDVFPVMRHGFVAVR